MVNLYPFREAIAKLGCSLEDAIENIDIGGPTMVRASAKNWEGVAIVVDAADYAALAAEMNARGGELSRNTRFSLAKKAFTHTAAYDAAIGNYLTCRELEGEPRTYPDVLTMQWTKAQDMRYGENPHQSAAFYRDETPAAGSLSQYTQLQGKELSYNNVGDADAAWDCVRAFDDTCCVIVKHANPCGVALGDTPLDAYNSALATDPTSAFGGIIAFNREVDAACAEAVAKQFLEVLIAPAYTAEALQLLAKKVNVRVLTVPIKSLFESANTLEMKRVGGGLLVQSADTHKLDPASLKVVTQLAPTAQQLKDMQFVWQVAQFVKSNAIVFAKDGRTLGIGAVQMSRVDSARIAKIKAEHAGLSLHGSVAASDAFFPFRDGLDVLIDVGAIAVIQPGGSMRDDEVINAANERGVAMVTTGVRHFRH